MADPNPVIKYDTAGSGIPLVFLHAFPLNKNMWSGFKTRFSRNFKFISIDLNGSMDYMAETVLYVLDEIGIREKAVVTGVSMGGYALFSLWKKAADRIRALGFVSTRATADAPQTREARMKLMEDLKEHGVSILCDKMIPNLISDQSDKTYSSLIQKINTLVHQSERHDLIASLQGMADRPDSTALLSHINVPCWVAYGEGDKVVKRDEMERLAQLLTKAKFQTFKEAGHLIPLEKPDQFQEAFLHFLKGRVL